MKPKWKTSLSILQPSLPFLQLIHVEPILFCPFIGAGNSFLKKWYSENCMSTKKTLSTKLSHSI
ncbi:unnamed protein product [Larinioides sclopetarius]|uniref:Uncharacterized protein n=1 Tax=Larinioides sclopetarius TaxID=280406 RepID=A0AAV1ZVH9_9ARAC